MNSFTPFEDYSARRIFCSLSSLCLLPVRKYIGPDRHGRFDEIFVPLWSLFICFFFEVKHWSLLIMIKIQCLSIRIINVDNVNYFINRLIVWSRRCVQHEIKVEKYRSFEKFEIRKLGITIAILKKKEKRSEWLEDTSIIIFLSMSGLSNSFEWIKWTTFV